MRSWNSQKLQASYGIGAQVEVLDQVNKLYMGLNLSFSDIFYQKQDPEIAWKQTRKFEHTQCITALAVKVAWKSTNKQKILKEICREKLYQRKYQ